MAVFKQTVIIAIVSMLLISIYGQGITQKLERVEVKNVVDETQSTVADKIATQGKTNDALDESLTVCANRWIKKCEQISYCTQIICPKGTVNDVSFVY